MSEQNQWREYLEEINDEDSPFIFWDGFDDAIIGYNETKVCYSYSKVYEQCLKDMGLNPDDEETPTTIMGHISFNITGGYLGENTPIMVNDMI